MQARSVLTGGCLATGQSWALIAHEVAGLWQETGQGLHLSQVLAICYREDPQASIKLHPLTLLLFS